MVKDEANGIYLVPELYAVPGDKVDAECENPGSQMRIGLGRCPFLWAQSLFIIGKLLLDVSPINISTRCSGWSKSLLLVSVRVNFSLEHQLIDAHFQ